MLPMSLRDVRELLDDPSRTWGERRARLQGWRGLDAARADAAVFAQRVGPAVCAVGAFVGASLQSPLLLAIVAVTAVVGTTAPNHPMEAVYNRWADRRGRPTLPVNRAAKRLGCAIGAVLLGGAAVAYAVGAETVGLVLALVLGGTATFVALTGICVPSLLFTTVWGVERACEVRLRAPRSVAPEPTR